jgi:ABC-type Zn uptake system ZnuABC Zn-binding protein ZnuA
VEQIVPDGASPHDYELSALDRLELEEADVVVANGAGLEAGIPLDDVDAPIWELADHAGRLRVATDGEEAGDADPHVWMSPSRVAQALPSLAAALAEADPEHAAAYRSRARAYQRRLLDLELEMRAEMENVKGPDRVLVTSHDSLSYFAERFGFEVAATVFPTMGAEAGASAASLDEVEDAIRATGVPAVFAQEGDDPEAMRTVADETGVDVEYGLLVESPGSARTYERMMREDAKLIAQAMGAADAKPSTRP